MTETQVREKPILFSGPMVRAILEGRKSQTRRVMVPQPTLDPTRLGGHWWPSRIARSMISIEQELAGDDPTMAGCFCPHGKPGDLLWVRETVAINDVSAVGDGCPPGHFTASTLHEANREIVRKYILLEHWRTAWENNRLRRRPSIHMPRWASRITLRIEDVRVERLQEISEADAKTEGVSRAMFPTTLGPVYAESHREAFTCLWDKIYANRGFGWATNPWVWVLTFSRVAD